MSGVLITICFFSYIWLLGYLVVLPIASLSRIERWGLSGLVGSGVLTLGLFILHGYFQVPFNAISSVILMGGLLLLGLLASRKQLKHLVHMPNLRSLLAWPLVDKLAAGLILGLLLSTYLQNATWPVTDWDSIALYDFRAKVMAESGSFLSAAHLGYYFQYPPYTSYLHALLYVFGVSAAKPLYSFLFGSLLMTFYALIRTHVKRTSALLATLLLAVTPLLFEHATVAYTNLPYTIFFGLGIIYLWQWIETSKAHSLLIGSIFVGLASWVRSAEPFWLISLALLALGAWYHRRQWHLIIAAACLLVGITYWWPSYDLIANPLIPLAAASPPPSLISQLLTGLTPGSLLTHAVEVTLYLQKYIIPYIGSLLLLASLATLSDAHQRHLNRFAIIRVVTITLLLGMIWAGTLIFSFTFETWNQIGGSVSRLTMFFIPLLIHTIFRSTLWSRSK